MSRSVLRQMAEQWRRPFIAKGRRKGEQPDDGRIQYIPANLIKSAAQQEHAQKQGPEVYQLNVMDAQARIRDLIAPRFELELGYLLD
jgi:hypothetical protein